MKLLLFPFFLVLTAFLTAAFCAPLPAQSFTVEHWTTRDGLPAAVYTITQTKDGALWIGTLNGLAKFDGVRFSVFTPENLPQLASTVIEVVAAGPDSQIYAGTDSGLTVLKDGRARLFQGPRGTDSSQVMMVLPVGVDEAWYGTAVGGLYHYAHGAVEAVGSGILPRTPVYGLAVAPDRTLWIATGVGLFSLRRGTIERYKPQVPLPVLTLFDLAFSRDGSLFAASDEGLFQIQGSHWKRFRTKDGLPRDPVTILKLDADGALWIGTAGGLARLQNGIIRPVSPVKCAVNSVFIDQERSVWTGCSDVKGLTRLTLQQIRFLQPPEGVEAKPILSLAQDRSDAVWMGSHQGLYRKESEGTERYTKQSGLPSNEVNSISMSHAGKLLIATYYGLASLDGKRIKLIHPKASGVANDVSAVIEDQSGTIWSVGLDGLRRSYRNQPGLDLVPGLEKSITSLVESRDGAVWVSTYSQGLFRFAGESRTDFNIKCGLGSNTVFDTAEDESGTVWVWTAAGLSRIRNNQCANLGERGGLTKGIVGQVSVDAHGHLWLITPKGIAVIDLAEVNQVIDHGAFLRKTRYIGPDDGLNDALSDSPPFRPMVMRPSGDIWIPTFSGIAVVSPEILRKPLSQLRPNVTSLVTDAGARDIGKHVKIQPGDEHLQFIYIAPYLRGVADREYRYRLKGFDLEWRDGTKNRDAVYTSLPAGKYRFEVSSRLPFEAWSDTSSPVDLEVLAKFYQTWWWYLLLALLLSSVLGLGFWLRLRALQTRYAMMMRVRIEERSRLARELHDTLSRGMMAIHFKIQLATTLLRSEPDAASGHLESAVGIIRQSASATRKSISALRLDEQENISLNNACARAVQNFRDSSSIPLEANVDAELPLVSEEVSHDIAQIIEEALANVRSHSGAGKASLCVGMSGKTLRIEVRDNGKGFDQPGQVSGHLNHFGLMGMKERAQRIHGKLETISVPGEGTRVALEISLLELSGRKKRNRNPDTV